MDSQWAALKVMGWVPQAPVKVCRYPMSTPVLERVALYDIAAGWLDE